MDGQHGESDGWCMLARDEARPAPTYRLFGLNLRSQMNLEGLAPKIEAGTPDVEIAFGLVSASDHIGYHATAEGTLLSVTKVGRYLIRDGRQILIDPAPGASERNLRLFLLGSAIGALLHQRGLLPLHANAINIGGRAVAFSGHSGAGKSTIAAWFHDRGYPILADDVCVIGFDDAGRALAYPGIPRLRLWREALEATGRDAGAYDRSFDDMDKYDVPTGGAAKLEPLPLAGIYLLHKMEEGSRDPPIQRLTGVNAVETLMSNTYRGAYLKTIGRNGEHLMQCLRVAQAVPIFQAGRVWGFESFGEQAEYFENHAREQA